MAAVIDAEEDNGAVERLFSLPFAIGELVIETLGEIDGEVLSR